MHCTVQTVNDAPKAAEDKQTEEKEVKPETDEAVIPEAQPVANAAANEADDEASAAKV